MIERPTDKIAFNTHNSFSTHDFQSISCKQIKVSTSNQTILINLPFQAYEIRQYHTFTKHNIIENNSQK